MPVAPERDLVRAANAPLSDILQLRVVDTYVPEFRAADRDGNTLAFAITMQGRPASSM